MHNARITINIKFKIENLKDKTLVNKIRKTNFIRKVNASAIRNLDTSLANA